MISQINFTEDLILERSEAENLGILYKEVSDIRIGYNDSKLKILPSYGYYRKDLIQDSEDSYINAKGEKISSYYIYDTVPEKDIHKDYVRVDRDNHLVDLLTFSVKCRYPFTIVRSIKTEEPSISNINYILSTIEEKTAKLDKLIQSTIDFNFNSKCNVHIGGGLLVTFNDLCLKEDTCTDALQAELNNGWRILAVCVQPDQRRPDYILGRYNPKLDTSDKTYADR